MAPHTVCMGIHSGYPDRGAGGWARIIYRHMLGMPNVQSYHPARVSTLHSRRQRRDEGVVMVLPDTIFLVRDISTRLVVLSCTARACYILTPLSKTHNCTYTLCVRVAYLTGRCVCARVFVCVCRAGGGRLRHQCESLHATNTLFHHV